MSEKIFSEKKEVRLLSDEEIKYMFTKLETPKYRFMASLMCYCGLRVTETCRLRISDFNWEGGYLLVNSLKKRKSQPKDKQFFTQQVKDYAAEYWATLKPKERVPANYMFPCLNNKASGNHLTRKQVWKVFNNACGYDPHWLRHYYISSLINEGTDFAVVMEMARHKDINTTRLYYTASEEQRRLATQKLEKSSFIQSLMNQLFPSKANEILPLSFSAPITHVGRKKEINHIIDLQLKKVNLILVGEQDVGKSHILKKLQFEKCFKIDTLENFKKTLQDMILNLCGGIKEKLAELLAFSEHEVITKMSITRLVEALKELTGLQEYTLIFDDVTHITPRNLTTLEKLAKHFHIIAATRKIEAKKATWLTSFEKVEIKPFTQLECFEMIDRNCKDFKERITDYIAFRTHIWNMTQGNPGMIVIALDRYRKERVIRADMLQEINAMIGRDNEINFAPIIIIALGFVVILKFWSRTGAKEDVNIFYMLAAIAMFVLMFNRRISSMFKSG